MTYFPAFSAKFTAGAYYRFTETWSAGLTSTIYWIPQWFLFNNDLRGKQSDNGLFANIGLSVRYHF